MSETETELQSLRQTVEFLKVENQHLREMNDEAQQELKAFRQIVFSRINGESNEAAKEATIRFPYTLKHRVVIFGGHDTWLKAIRPMLKNVRFVGREQTPDGNLIKRADVIWIQTNALTHACYANIMDIARSYGIAVRYFTSASAERCANDIAQEDMK